MGFFGRSFTFDNTPCEMYDLMLYDMEEQDTEIMLGGSNSIEEEVIGDKWKPYFYGTKAGEKLEFDLTFGVNTRRIDKGKFLDRWEIADVSAWLCGHREYKWLFIDQPDIRPFGYHCMISEPRVTRYGTVPWALKVHVVCDSPYAYLEPIEYTHTVNGQTTFTLLNESSLNQFYLPFITINLSSGNSFSVTNAQDDDHGPELTDIPGSVTEITLDNEHCVLSNNQGINLYDGFNFQFLRLARGYNELTASGKGQLTIRCEYPVNIGG